MARDFRNSNDQMKNGKWQMANGSSLSGLLLPTIAFILFYLGKHPIEFT